MSQAQFIFLGTGGSSGIPMVGCRCPVCSSNHPYNKRLRPSGLLTINGKRILLDAGPDFRMQALKFGIDRLDGLLITHAHFDHVAGLDELRVYYLQTRTPLPVLLSEPTYLDLRRRYDYLFREKNWNSSLTAQFDFQVLEGSRGTIDFLGFPITFIRFEQGGMPVTGFRFGDFAYVSDIRTYPSTIFDDLKGVKILVLSALRSESSLMHFNVQEAAAFAKKIGVDKAYLTHIGHELDHEAGNAELPPEVRMSYDGLTLNLDGIA